MVLRVFRHFVPVSILCLAISDLVLVSLAFHLSAGGAPLLSSRIPAILGSPPNQLSAMAAVAALLSGLYDDKSFATYRTLLAQIFLSFVFCSAVILAGNFYFSGWSMPADWLWEGQKAVVTWLVCILFTRTVFVSLTDLNAFKRRVLVLGAGRNAARVAALARNSGMLNFTVVAHVKDASLLEQDAAAPDAGTETVLLKARQLRVQEIVLATDDRRGLPIKQLLQCRRDGIKVTNYLDFIERETNSIDIDALQPGWLLLCDGFRLSHWRRVAKRYIDVLLSLALLLLSLPLMLATALLIFLDSGAPVLYRQERVGMGGRPFVLLKFRSMKTDAERDGKARWAASNDARVTRVGSIIRKFRIDELPQLLNVLRGDMSFVGPRPERPVFVDELSNQIPFYAERHWVKPGITGWAQVKYRYGSSLEDARTKLSYDLYYVKNQSPFLDLIIALQTIRVVLRADGAR